MVRIYMRTQQRASLRGRASRAPALALRKRAGVFVNRLKLPPHQPTPIACGAEIVVRARIDAAGHTSTLCDDTPIIANVGARLALSKIPLDRCHWFCNKSFSVITQCKTPVSIVYCLERYPA